MRGKPLKPKQPSGILAMNPEKYREIDGVVLDLDSYERHCAPAPAVSAQTACQPSPDSVTTDSNVPVTKQPATVQPVFPCDPVHVGWYETSGEAVAYPIMGGVAYRPCGSGSGSYLTSFMTSHLLGSGSWLYGSGSGRYGSGSCGGSGELLCGGYGLELI